MLRATSAFGQNQTSRGMSSGLITQPVSSTMTAQAPPLAAPSFGAVLGRFRARHVLCPSSKIGIWKIESIDLPQFTWTWP